MIATPIMLLALFSYGISFSTNYEVFIGSIPLYLSASIVYVSRFRVTIFLRASTSKKFKEK